MFSNANINHGFLFISSKLEAIAEILTYFDYIKGKHTFNLNPQ